MKLPLDLHIATRKLTADDYRICGSGQGDPVGALKQEMGIEGLTL